MASGGEQELSFFDLACAKVSQAQQLMSEARELLKKDLDNVKQEKSAFLELTKTLNEVHFGSKVKLNVGGKIYSTTLDTLRKDPDSMLCAMFSGRHELKPDAEDGAYFIDRDGKLFRYILNYLRDGNVYLPDEKITQQELLKEAKFYQVQGIIDLLEEKSSPPMFDSSVILKNEREISVIKSWLGPGARCSLLFRASIHGTSPAKFHHRCDNKGATLLVINTGVYIYGGYTSKSWESPVSLTAKPDGESFLFTLVNPFGSNPVKITCKPDADGGGILCSQGLGPSFGIYTHGDLLIWNERNQSISSLNVGGGFTCPVNANEKTYFTGKNLLEIHELEVFEVNF
ncbi:uncharacterized protein [Montipora capricornis]|uniref:uncharacterized protein isoform X2 n=1 Tax=Montipora capricornis TaxID=246305 RepID=UPI0035F12109